MNLGFGMGEIILIAMMVLIVFGPRRLPEITRTIGKGIREFRKGMNEIQRELEEAGRETRWRSPPAPPKPANPSASATIAGTAMAASVSSDASEADGAATDADAADENAAGAAAAAAAAAGDEATGDEATGDDATDDAGGTSTPVLEEQAPPVPRDMVDPAAEFIDPWSTDSSRPTVTPKPRPEPVIAPPTTEPAEGPPAESSGDAARTRRDGADGESDR